MKKLAVLAVVLAMMLAAASPSQSEARSQNLACSELGDSGEQAQQQARVLLNQDPSGHTVLDADGDGIPCEFTESAGQISYEDGSVIFIDKVAPLPAPNTPTPQIDKAGPLQAPPPASVVVSDDGQVTIDGDIGTNCRSFAISVEDGYFQRLTPEQKQNVLDRCKKLGFLPSEGTDSPAGEDQYVSDQPTPSQQPAPTKPEPSASPRPTPNANVVDKLPDTGGASPLALGAGALLVAGGLAARRVVR